MSVDEENTPIFTQSQAYEERGDTGAPTAKLAEKQSRASGQNINTAHNTATNLIATTAMLGSTKRFLLDYVSIHNLESYALTVEIYDGTTKRDEWQIPANGSLVISKETGLYYFTTSVNFKTQSGNAFSSGTNMTIAGLWMNV